MAQNADGFYGCPFCGSQIIHVRSTPVSSHWYVQCQTCSTAGGFHKTLQDAVWAWNKRNPQTLAELSQTMETLAEWKSVATEKPDRKEPIVYCKKAQSRWAIGIGYWTVSEKWHPDLNSVFLPNGFTHWIPLPTLPPTQEEQKP